MIGVGPHTMGAADWTFLAALQVGLLLAAVFAVRLAVRTTRSSR